MAKEQVTVLPFTDEDLVGPEDRPKPEWSITMYGWQGRGNPTIKDYFDSSAGGVATAVQMAPKPKEGVIYVRTCSPQAAKAHNLTPSTDHQTVYFSLYTPLLTFNFPKVDANHKAIFPCRPQTFGDQKVLVIDVTNYRVVKVDKATREEQVALAQATAAVAAADNTKA